MQNSRTWSFILTVFGLLLIACESSPTKDIDSQPPDTQDLGPSTPAPNWGSGGELTLLDITDTTLTISWAPVVMESALVAYQIHQDGALLTQVEPTIHLMTFSHLEPSRTYLFSVIAIDGLDRESSPLELEVTTHQTPVLDPRPTPPQWPDEAQITLGDLIYGDQGTPSIDVSWTPIEPTDQVQNYVVFLNGAEHRRLEENSLLLTLESVSRWHTLEIRALHSGDAWIPGALNIRFYVEANENEVSTPLHERIQWPEGAEIDLDQAGSDTVIRWPALILPSALDPAFSSTQEVSRSLFYRVDSSLWSDGDEEGGESEGVEVPHTQDALSLVLPALPENELVTFTVEALFRDSLSDEVFRLGSLSTERTGRDRTPPRWIDASGMPKLTYELDSNELLLRWPRAIDDGGEVSYQLLADDLLLSLITPDLVAGQIQMDLTSLEWRLEGDLPPWGSRLSVIAVDEADLTNQPLDTVLLPPREDPIQWPPFAQIQLHDIRAESVSLSWPPLLQNHDVVSPLYYLLNVGPTLSIEIPANQHELEVEGLISDYIYELELHAVFAEQTDRLQTSIHTPPYPQPIWIESDEFSIEDLTHHTALLSWAPTAQRSYTQTYELYVHGELVGEVNARSDDSSEDPPNDSGDSFSFLLADLSPNTEHEVSLVAVGPTSLRSSQTPSLSFHTLERPTLSWSETATLTAASLSDTEVHLTWSAWGGEDPLLNYELYQDRVLYQTVDPSTLELSIDGLRPNRVYHWHIQARGLEGGFSNDGPSSSHLQPDTHPPAWPDPYLTLDATSSNSLSVSWGVAEDADQVSRYVIRVNDQDEHFVGNTLNSFTLEGLIPDTLYTLHLEAEDQRGNRSADGPTLTTSTESIIQVPTTEEVMLGLQPTCSICHGGCPQCLNDWFSSLELFNTHIAQNPALVRPGQADASELIELLEGTSSGIWGQMPPTYFGDGASYEARRARGETSLTVDEIRSWINALSGDSP